MPLNEKKVVCNYLESFRIIKLIVETLPLNLSCIRFLQAKTGETVIIPLKKEKKSNVTSIVLNRALDVKDFTQI